MSPNLAGPLLALAAFALFATHDVVVKVLGARYAPAQIIFFSVLMSFPLATLLLIRDPVEGHLRPVHPWWSGLRVAAVVVTGLAGFTAFASLPLAQVYTLIFAAPLFVTMLSIPVLGERVGPHRWGAVAVGLLGVIVVLRPWSAAADLSAGHGFALLAAAGSATASVTVRKIGQDERGVVLLLYPMMANVVVMGALLSTSYTPMPFGDLCLVAVISILGFGATLLSIAAWRSADAALVAPMHYSQILWATGFGALLFDELPDRYTLLGATIIIGSGLYVVVREARGGSATRPVIEARMRPDPQPSPRIAEILRRRATRMPPGHEALAKRRKDS